MELMTPEDLAGVLRTSRRDVVRRASTGEYPHIRIGKRYRFTSDHVEQIKSSHEVAPAVEPANPWGVRTRGRRAS